MWIKTYREFEITGAPRQQFVAEMDGVEFVHEDLGEVDANIDRYYEDLAREASAATDSALERMAREHDEGRIGDVRIDGRAA